MRFSVNWRSSDKYQFNQPPIFSSIASSFFATWSASALAAGVSGIATGGTAGMAAGGAQGLLSKPHPAWTCAGSPVAAAALCPDAAALCSCPIAVPGVTVCVGSTGFRLGLGGVPCVPKNAVPAAAPVVPLAGGVVGLACC